MDMKVYGHREDKDTYEFFENFQVKVVDGVFGVPSVNGFRICDNTWIRSTGLKDSAGKDIYEGDIITCTMSQEHHNLPHMGEIVWNESFGAFATKNQAGETLLHNLCLHTIKKVGNRFQNPELLGEQTND